ncbi:hypothetical protein R75461_07428 [Paraburkholderia nemoris]|nr:hypothetical protein R75461_07428 [Paraburkholderia nemoris]
MTNEIYINVVLAEVRGSLHGPCVWRPVTPHVTIPPQPPGVASTPVVVDRNPI